MGRTGVEGMIDRTEKDDMWAEKAVAFENIVSSYFQYESYIQKIAGYIIIGGDLKTKPKKKWLVLSKQEKIGRLYYILSRGSISLEKEPRYLEDFENIKKGLREIELKIRERIDKGVEIVID
jgi:hypothetical protein